MGRVEVNMVEYWTTTTCTGPRGTGKGGRLERQIIYHSGRYRHPTHPTLRLPLRLLPAPATRFPGIVMIGSGYMQVGVEVVWVGGTGTHTETNVT